MNFGFCKEVLSRYNLNLEEEQRLARQEFAGEYAGESHFNADDEDDGTLNMSFKDSEAARGKKLKA